MNRFLVARVEYPIRALRALVRIPVRLESLIYGWGSLLFFASPLLLARGQPRAEAAPRRA
ncbi:MAG TPA: hypothetical protein VKB78_12920 [Pirellulales bacterium]|nr:hypothetical protein [Pirellulales bacterium]